MIPLFFVVCLFLSGCMTSSQGYKFLDIKPTVKVLSINLCADWANPRQDRANRIIQLVRDEKIDIVLTQEGIKGVGQFDMVKYIAETLDYSYCQSPAFGVPGFLEYCVGIISAYPISNAKTVGCQVSGGDPIDKVPFPGSGRGIMANVDGIQVMSSHLTVPVEQDQREKQVKCLRSALSPGTTIWGGDFNFNRNNPAYLLVNLQEALYSGEPRVDMVFSSGLSILESRLVFEDHFVSDHYGVLVTYSR